ncbi:hypothetical protein DYU05_04035 [Mucilaginibacter terrenus]|uniref:NrS-1 polymerase-like helicase domain-containing protein n=1 Tax=Mucilaginibacter terrenus TaxID=2482727 RepID=A0A3E2NUV6_9SPHI|nr:primase-helicase family protein [Mucilaginibacter terrenus]RFZ84785.1 hypothetical protein DYU05_04035 [Mucilaginibacter terrenus]
MAKQSKKVTKIDPATIDTYFKKRMFEIGITDTSEHYFVVEGDFPSPDFKQPIFAPADANDPNSNIVIHYPCLYGGAEPIDGSEVPFTRVRYSPEHQPAGNVKYFQERGTGVHIFHPPAVVKKFKAKEHIDTLILTEGEFKAYTGSLAGLDIIGLGGKDSFRDADKKNLHPDIAAIVRDCTVTNVLLLLDADTLQVKWDQEEEPYKDLQKSLHGFFLTAVNFREAVKNDTLGIRDVFFGHLKLDNIKPDKPKESIKGLDDLLYKKRLENPDLVKFVTDDIARLGGAKVYFDVINLGTLTPKKIRDHFWLSLNRNVPSAFYANNQQLIKEREFVFGGATYKFNPEVGLELLKHADTDKYVRIGIKYYKMIEIPDANGVLQPQLEIWSPTEIERDYGKGFLASVDKYDAFCNVPCNTEKFEKTPFGCFNVYYPLTHELEPGGWSTIEGALKHLFGERVLASGFTSYELILDYYTILYNHPTQALPIVVLFSEKRNTGKSTGMWIAEDMFLANYTEITGDILEDHLNDDWATKLVIGIDEGIIEKNKTLQKLKSLSTAHKIKLRGMYAGRKPVPFFGKFWITTNDKNFVKVDKEETRFWINEVPQLKAIDPDIRQKIQAEIPAFLAYLSTREILHKKVSRHWFHPDDLATDIGNQVKENSRGWFEKELTVILTNKFFHYKYHTLYFTHEEVELWFANKAVKFRSDDIRTQLKEKFGLVAKLGRWKQPNEPDINLNTAVSTCTKHLRCYTFRIEDFVSEEVIREELSEYMDYDAIVSMRGTQKHTSNDNDDLPF